MKNNKLISSLAFLLVLLLIVGGSFFYYLKSAQSQDLNTDQVLEVESVEQIIPEFSSPEILPTESASDEAELVAPIEMVATQSGETAFDLLISKAEVEYKEYDFGNFIESIDGVAGNNDYFWAFYVNGEKATQGADQTKLEKGDLVKWVYEKIEF